MKAYVVRTTRAIGPLGDSPRDCLIGNRTLRGRQESVLRGLGMQLVDVEDEREIQDQEEHLILTDSLYFNETLLQRFVVESRGVGKRTVCALRPGIFTLRTVVATQRVAKYDDHIEYGLRYVPPGAPTGDPAPIVLDADRLHQNLPMPQHLVGSPGYDIPLPDMVAMQIDHWANLWSANMASLLEPVAAVLSTPRWKLLASALRARSTNQWRIASKLNQIGRNCDIHPTAYVEGSTIGDGVQIGAGSVVRECNIGSRATIENGATLNFSVLGERCYIADGTMIRYSVIYPDTFFGFSRLSCQLIGRGCFVGGGVTFTDYRLDGRCITVLCDGAVVDTGNRIMGSCIGHSSYIGTGTIVAPGRAIPNGTRILPEDSNVVQEIKPNGTIARYRQINDTARAG